MEIRKCPCPKCNSLNTIDYRRCGKVGFLEPLMNINISNNCKDVVKGGGRGIPTGESYRGYYNIGNGGGNSK